MFTMSEIIVLLWLVPVAMNILLPLTVLGFSFIIRIFKLTFARADYSQEEKEYQRQLLSTAGN